MNEVHQMLAASSRQKGLTEEGAKAKDDFWSEGLEKRRKESLLSEEEKQAVETLHGKGEMSKEIIRLMEGYRRWDDFKPRETYEVRRAKDYNKNGVSDPQPSAEIFGLIVALFAIVSFLVWALATAQ